MGDLKFGVFDHLDRGDRSISALFDERLEIVDLYERTGFHCYHVAEHHSTPLGMAPSPGIFLSAVASRTKTLRFGPLVYLLPLYHPLRISEEIAMLDQLSHGRLDVGVGRGRSPIELSLYGQSVEAAQEIFEETFEIMTRAFTYDILNFSGKHFNFANVPVELRTWQKPHPPLWYGVGSPQSAKEFGGRGFNGVTLAKSAVAAELTQAFFASSVSNGHRDKLMGLCRFIVVGETDREAQTLASRAFPVWHESFFELFRRFDQKPVQTWPATFEAMAALGLAFAGSPDTLKKTLGDELAAVGSNYLMGQFVFGDMTVPEATRSIELFATRVAPALREQHRMRTQSR